MRMFITMSFKDGEIRKEVEEICKIVDDSGFESFCYRRDVENYEIPNVSPKQLMLKAKEEIEKSDLLLFDATEKSTGRAIEVGIAYANKKKIVVIAKKGTVLKETLIGVADQIIDYEKIEDIKSKLSLFCNSLKI